jgi:hypothetical protein
MKSCFWFLLTVGSCGLSALGQAKPVPKSNLSDLWMGRNGQQMHAETVDLDCESFIDWKPWGAKAVPYPVHPKKVKDIWPEECGSGKVVWGGDSDDGYVFIGSSLPECGHKISCPLIAGPKSPDIPAIQEKPKCAGGCVPPPDYWTCADKRRILLTSEDGKKWCHTPQTGVTSVPSSRTP